MVSLDATARARRRPATILVIGYRRLFPGDELDRVLYPWDDHIPGGEAFAEHPPSWDWSFTARP